MRLLLGLFCCLFTGNVMTQCAIRCNTAQGYFLDQENCRCVKRPQILCRKLCPPGQKLESPCNCVPEKQEEEEPVFCIQSLCPDGSPRDPKTCGCPEKPQIVCLKLCPPGQRIEPPCNCVPEKEEPVFCIQSLCPDGSSRDPKTCKCPEPFPNPICIQSICPKGQKRDPKDCQCKPLMQCKKLCPSGYELTGFCDCTKKPPVICKAIPCPPGTRRKEGSCDCVRDPILQPLCLIKSCKPGFELDKNCRCVISFGAICEIGCPPGLRVYPGRCECVRPITCAINSCQRGYSVGDDCQCEESSSTLPIFIQPQCRIRKCAKHYKLDSKSCQCKLPIGPTCRRACPAGKIMISPCKCVRRRKCPIKKCVRSWKRDKKSCKCVKKMNFLSSFEVGSD